MDTQNSVKSSRDRDEVKKDMSFKNDVVYDCHQSKPKYCKFLPKTQSLDIVDETSIANINLDTQNCFESINEELLTDFVTDDSGGRQVKSTTSRDEINATCQARPIFPNLSYSPLSSPRINRKPAKESRRVSIDKNGSFLQLNQYKLMDQIGVGAYGFVIMAYNEEEDQHYAMKILSKKKLLRKAGIGFNRGHPKRGVNIETPLDRVYKEIAVLKKLDHPNVVKLVEVLDDPVDDALYMVFELVTQGEVLNVPTSNPLTEERAWFIFRQVILGIEYLFMNNIVHGDIKPQNLLLANDDVVKVADLGVCNEFLGDDAQIDQRTASGTPAFRAPETLSGQKLYFDGKKADIWSLGITLFSFVFGDIPWKSTSVPILYEQIKTNDVTFPSKITISDDLKDLLIAMLEKDPEKRVSLEALKIHVWITKNGQFEMPCQDDCTKPVEISEEDISTVFKSIPKLDTLILIKKMLKNHSFQNPFLSSAIGTGTNVAKNIASRLSKLERFQNNRSNSAPGNYQTFSPCNSKSSTNELNQT
ncbi:calcium/calmodulin-dependent protein kinase kinase 2 [Chironomus tepperi]|uniref:calcium/calmodulin-dependent protein kinase kinase 2 n=1 Tax=Chironomus tepperi TaxID=113505 RepID=UPI00391F4793